MDFKAIKEKAIQWKKSFIKAKNELVEKSAEKFRKSHSHIQKKEELDAFIEKSKTYANKEGKEIKKKIFLLVVDTKTEFYKKLLYMFPVIYTKAWSKDIAIKLIDKELSWFNYKEDYNVSVIPALLVFEEEKITHRIEGEENLRKLIKKMSLDIEKTIAEI